MMVCQTLASIAIHAPGTWNHVTSNLLEYLDSKVEDRHELIVSRENNVVVVVIVVVVFIVVGVLQLPVSAVLMQLHQGETHSPQRQYFHNQVRPSLLKWVWQPGHSSRFWVAYKVARKASMMVRNYRDIPCHVEFFFSLYFLQGIS